MNKEIDPPSQSLAFIKEKIHSGSCAVFFDVDGTIKGSKTVSEPMGFDPQLPYTLQMLREISGVNMGICTSQSFAELAGYLSLLSNQNEQPIFWDHLVLEDGHVYLDSSQNIHEFISPETKKQLFILQSYLVHQIVHEVHLNKSEENWGFFPGILTPVNIPTDKYQGQYTLSIWEKGPSVTDMDYNGQFEPVEEFVNLIINKFHLHRLETIEVGNGTLRVLEKGLSKASAFEHLATLGHIDLAQSIFVCDGVNDIAAAKKIIDIGGVVIAVSNAVSELKHLATHVTREPQSKGVVEVLQKALTN